MDLFPVLPSPRYTLTLHEDEDGWQVEITAPEYCGRPEYRHRLGWYGSASEAFREAAAAIEKLEVK
jgi:hypothetical protein